MCYGILRKNGLRISQAGQSYRPASNGTKYKYYLRVSDESDNKPDPEQVRSILAAHEAPAEQGTAQTTELTKLSKELAARERELARLRSELSAEKQRQRRVAQRLDAVTRQNQELRSNSRSARQEHRRAVNELELELRRIREAALPPETAAQIRKRSEDEIEALRRDVEAREKDLAAYHESFDPEIRELESKVTDLERMNAELEAQVAVLSKFRADDTGGASTPTVADEAGKEDSKQRFLEVIGVLLDNIEFLRGSLDTLWHEMPDLKAVLRALKGIGGNIRSLNPKRVRSTKGWWELHVSGDWRLYFKKRSEAKCPVFISHKNSQKKDIEWLRAQ